jgi:hypothetical protein
VVHVPIWQGACHQTWTRKEAVVFRTLNSRRALLCAISAISVVALVGTGAAEAKKKPPRPTVTIVKKGFTNTWDTEFEHTTGGPGSITLKFEKVRLGKTRRNRGESIQMPYGTWYTPAQATFVQTIDHETCEPELSSPYVQAENPCTTNHQVTRVVATGNFYKSDFGWRYVPKGATTKTIG